MKFGFSLLSFGLGLAASSLDLAAQTDDAAKKDSKTLVQIEAMQLIRQDAGIFSSVTQPQAIEQAAADLNEVLLLEPLKVTKQKIPDLIPPVETFADKFFRTGTIAQHVGKKFTTTFSLRPETGLSIGFSW